MFFCISYFSSRTSCSFFSLAAGLVKIQNRKIIKREQTTFSCITTALIPIIIQRYNITYKNLSTNGRYLNNSLIYHSPHQLNLSISLSGNADYLCIIHYNTFLRFCLCFSNFDQPSGNLPCIITVIFKHTDLFVLQGRVKQYRKLQYTQSL